VLVQVHRADGGVIACEIVGDGDGAAVLVCHGLADSRRSAWLLDDAARQLGLRVIVPDRPGIGLSDPRRLEQVADWVDDALVVLDALGVTTAGVLGISGAVLRLHPLHGHFSILEAAAGEMLRETRAPAGQ
jgi:pimeloyl-ACP methyl ester carboxylesterase